MIKKITIVIGFLTISFLTYARVNDYTFYNWSESPLEITVKSLTGSKSCVARIGAYGPDKKSGVCETLDVNGAVLGQNCLGTLDIRKVDPQDPTKKTDWHINFPVVGCYSQAFTIDANGLPFAGNIAPAAKPGSLLDFKVLADGAKQALDELKQAGINIAAIGGSLLLSIMDADAKNDPVNFCTNMEATINEPSIDDATVVAEDTEKILPIIKQYSPIFYLHSRERAYPISASELFGKQLDIVAQDSGTSLVTPRTLTILTAYDTDNRTDVDKYKFQFTHPCVRSGANITTHKDTQGNLNTRAYAYSWEDPKYPNKFYVHYMTLFAFNFPYDVRKLIGLVKSPQDAEHLANAHDFDLEHITMEFDKNTKQPLRIYFGSHGSKDGSWLSYNSPEVQKDGTHPIVYVARGGHGLYNRAGTVVRVKGFANDEEQAGLKWVPVWTRLYAKEDPRFKKEIHGWGEISHLWKGPMAQTSWWNDLNNLGKPYNQILYCPPANPLDDAMCKAKLAPLAEVPAH